MKPCPDGLQASRHIKSDETLSKTPAIVLVTAFGREEVREEAERVGLVENHLAEVRLVAVGRP